jgi:hypothetical protein
MSARESGELYLDSKTNMEYKLHETKLWEVQGNTEVPPIGN